MSNTEEDKKLLNKLKSSLSSDVYSALIKIRKDYVRNRERMRRLSKLPVIKIIISFMEHPKFCNISLSIIADACLEQSLMLEVIKNNGINCLIRIMERSVNDDVHNRACRALGNIAKSKIGYEAVHAMKPISNIIKFLTGTTDKNCQQTAVRTLRILCKDSKSRDIIVRENGIIHISQLLHSGNKEVLKCSIRAIAELTENCSLGCARQIIEMQGLKILVELYSHSEKEISQHALMSLKNLSALDEMRTDLTKVGAVKLFSEVSRNDKSSEMSRLAILALCNSVDRLHMWGNYGVPKNVGLEVILEVLRCNELEDIHGHIIIALLPLCYEQGVPDILFELGIVKILIQILKRFISHNKDEHSNPVFDSIVLSNDTLASDIPIEIEVEDLSASSITSFSSEEDILFKESYFENSNFSSDIYSSALSKFSCVNSGPNLSPVKNIPKYDYSSYLHLHSSGASSNCSPCSSRSNNATSPNVYSDSDLSSVADPWSPQSNMENNVLCWSPVLSCSEDSSDEIEDKKSEVQKLSGSISTSEPIKTICNLDECCPSSSKNDIKSDSLFVPIGNEKVEFYNTEKESVKLETLNEHKKSSTSGKHKTDAELVPTLEDTPVNKKLKLSSNSKPLLKMEIPPEKCALVELYNIEKESVKLETLHEYKKSTSGKHKTEAELVPTLEETPVNKKLKLSSNSKPLLKMEIPPEKCALVELYNTEKESVKLETLREYKKSSTSGKHKTEAELVPTLEETPVNKKLKLSNSKPLQKVEIPPEKCALDNCVLVLLTQLSFHLEKRTNSEMASRDCFSVLMDYIVSFQNPNPKAEKLLINLVKNRYCFEKLIMSGFVTEMGKILTVKHTTNCMRCSKVNDSYINLLSALRPEAESVYGIGTLYHILSTSEETSQFYAIHAISNLIRKQSSLFKLIIQGNGLSLLFNSFLATSKTTESVAVLSLCQIYQSLPKTKTCDELEKCCFSKSCRLKVTSKCIYLDATTYNVTFLTNDQKVLASREKLCENSDYFSALLEGHFSEKEKDTVKMPNISAETLTSIFHFLHGCKSETICLFLKEIPFAELLKLLSESEKFLLFDFKAFVIDRLCHNFGPKEISQIYQVAKIFNSPLLYQKVLHFVLSMNISQKDVLLKSFEDLMSLKDYNVINDIKFLIQNIFAECHYV